MSIELEIVETELLKILLAQLASAEDTNVLFEYLAFFLIVEMLADVVISESLQLLLVVPLLVLLDSVEDFECREQ
jgi:hypothetical protein